MGFFDRFRKKYELPTKEEQERLENVPELLSVKLLFREKTVIDKARITEEAGKYFNRIDTPGDEAIPIYGFPDHTVDLLNATGAAQCIVAPPNEGHSGMDIPEFAFQQNWQWPEANETARACSYGVLITDILTRTMDYKERLHVFMNFVVAVTKATNPAAIFSFHGQKIIDPGGLLKDWGTELKPELYTICNIRLYNISDSTEKEIIMDTVGLHALGLTDFQLRFSGFDENDIAQLLWNYASYVYENGDIIENGSTIQGLETGSKWKCERQIGLLQPERVVINIVPQE